MFDDSRKLLAVFVACLAVLLIATPAFSQASNAGGTFAHRQILGPEVQSKQIAVTFWLKQHNKAAFDELVRQMYDKSSPNYHHWLTLNEYKTRFAPTAADVAVVRQHLAANNLTVTGADKFNHFVTARGTVADVQRATGVQLNRVSTNGNVNRVPANALAIPGNAGTLVAAVQGLSDLKYENHAKRALNPETGKPNPLAHVSSHLGPAVKFFNANCFHDPQTRNFKSATATASYRGSRYGNNINAGPPNLSPCGYDVPQVDKAYGLTDLFKQKLDGTGQTIVIVDAFGDDTIANDANIFSSINGLPALTDDNFQIFFPTGPAACNNACGSWDVETALDVEWSHSVAPGANIALLLAADNSFTNLDLSVLFALETGLGPVVSNSYGIGEIILQEFDPAELVVQDSLNQLGASLGVSVNFSSGDDGDYLLRYGVTTVSAPASSPFATGVGGTSLFLNTDHSIKFQTGWGNNQTRIADVAPNPPQIPPLQFGFVGGAGGGTSAFYAKPSYQNNLPGAGRLVPDIGYLADPFTGGEFVITEGGQPGIGVVGGTSLACPMFSAMWAIATQSAGTWLGQAAPLLYNLPPDAITDVLATEGPANVSGKYHVPPSPVVLQSSDDLLAPENSSDYVSALYNGSSTRWYAVSFGTDTSLTAAPGWDNITGLGTPNGAAFVHAVSGH